MRINCLACGHMVDLEDDYDDYEGQIKCYACGAMLEIRTDQGKIKAVKLVKGVPTLSTEEMVGASLRG